MTLSTMSRITLICALAALICVSGTALAQEPPPVSGRIDDIDDSDFPEVRAIVTLVDGDGRPITGLSAEDFEATESDAAARVTSVETVLDQQIGVGVILVIDTSGSMEGEPIVSARNAARGFVESLEPADQAAIISFANGVTVESALSADRGATLAALDRLAAVGNTALYSGVVQAVEQARTAGLPRKVIILLSDGLDFGGASQNTRQEALALAAEARVPVYAIGLGDDIDRPFLQELASASGGAFIEAPAPSRIPEIYDQLSQLLRSQYVLTIESDAPSDRTARSLLLVANSPQGRIELTAEYTTSRTIIPATPTTVPPTAVPAATAAEVEEESGSSLVLPVLIVVLGLGGLALGAVYYRRMRARRHLAQETEAMSLRAVDELAQEDYTPPVIAPAGPTRSLKLSGPAGEETFEIGDEPMTLGSGSECQIRLETGEGAVAEQHARVWLRDGRLMLHHLAPRHESLVAGRPVTWVSLETGDEVQIGPYRLRVEP